MMRWCEAKHVNAQASSSRLQCTLNTHNTSSSSILRCQCHHHPAMATISTCFTATITTPTPRFHSRTRLLSLPLSQHHTAKPSSKSNFQFLQNQGLWGTPRRRVWSLVPRATVDGDRWIKPGGVVETDKLPTEVRKRTMEAVDASGGRVTIGDVASRAGLKLVEAQKALQALAADTDGFLEVSDEGDVLYVFRKDYRSKLAAKSFRIKAEPLIEKAKAAGEYLIRVSFGTTLIASIVIVYTAIIALLTSSRSEDDNRGRRGRSYDSGFTFFFNPVDIFW